MKPTPQMADAPQNTRLFHLRSASQRRAISGSAGQAYFLPHISHAVTIRRIAEPRNSQPFSSLRTTSTGNWLVNAATTVPKPKLTTTIGMAQQMSVPVDANTESQPTAVVRASGLLILTNNTQSVCLSRFPAVSADTAPCRTSKIRNNHPIED